MKILFFLGTFPALSETFVLGQITGLLTRGHDVEIFARTPGTWEYAHPDVHHYRLRQRVFYPLPASSKNAARWARVVPMLARAPHGELGPLLRSLNMLDRANRRLKAFFSVVPCFRRGFYDVIHAHFGTNGARAAHLREIGALRGKLVTSFHGFDMSRTIRRSGTAAYSRLFGTGDLFAPVSDCWKAHMSLTRSGVSTDCNIHGILDFPQYVVQVIPSHFPRARFQASV